MASSSDLEELYDQFFNPRKVMETYLSQESLSHEDAVLQVFPPLLRFFSGAVKGDSLIHISIAPFIHFTLPACEYFTDITFACTNKNSVQELQKWLRRDPDAMDWSPAVKMVCGLQGCSGRWMEKQKMLQSRIQRVVKCDVSGSDPLSPVVLAPADCLLLTHCLECQARDKATFCAGLRNVSSLLKSGGHLILIMALGATFYMVGDFKLPHLCAQECLLSSALAEVGYAIEEHHIFHRKAGCLYDVTDFTHLIILKARKGRAVQSSDI